MPGYCNGAVQQLVPFVPSKVGALQNGDGDGERLQKHRLLDA